MKIMLRPPSRSLSRTANRRSISGGDNAEVGSSRIMMRAPENSTRDSSTSCWTPIGKSPRRARGLMARPRFLSCSAAALRHPPPGDDAHPVHGLRPEKDVLGHAQFLRDGELLMHHADAGGQRVARGAEMDRLPVDAHGPGIGGMDAGDDLHHRAFAGAVLAGQSVDLAGVQREVDTAQRLDAAKRLRTRRSVRAAPSLSASEGDLGSGFFVLRSSQ